MSNPPEDKEAILCSISGEIDKFSLILIKVGASADNVIPNPPEAEAVRPQIIFTEIASEIIGLEEIFIIPVCIDVKIGNALIILP